MDTQYDVKVNGAQLISFAPGISETDKNSVLNTHLLAQIFADESGKAALDPAEWEKRYASGLRKLKWNMTESRTALLKLDRLATSALSDQIYAHLCTRVPSLGCRQLSDALEQFSALEFQHAARQIFRNQVLSNAAEPDHECATAINFDFSLCVATNHVFSLFISIELAIPPLQDFLHQAFYGADCIGDALFLFSHRTLNPGTYRSVREKVDQLAHVPGTTLRAQLPHAGVLQ